MNFFSLRSKLQIYSICEIVTTFLLFLSILWGPWAFGTVHEWSVLCLNIINYNLGIFLVTKLFIRRSLISHNFVFDNKTQIKNWRYKAIFFLCIYILIYIVLSILNYKSNFNENFKFFEYNGEYLKWLPSTHDTQSTISALVNIIGLAFCFCGVRDWLINEEFCFKINTLRRTSDSNKIFKTNNPTNFSPKRLSKLFWFMSVNAGLLALIGIIQRFDGTKALLWVYDRSGVTEAEQSFGPYGYRSNALSYLNLIWPITLNFLAWGYKNNKSISVKKYRKSNEHFYVLIPLIILMFAGILLGLSRGGLLTFLILILVFSFNFLKRVFIGIKINWRNITFILTTCVTFLICLNNTNWKERFYHGSEVYETNILKPNFEETITLRYKLPDPPFDKQLSLLKYGASLKSEFTDGLCEIYLYENGNLQTILRSHRNQTEAGMIFTNLPVKFKDSNLELIINRSHEGFEVKANDITLSGYEKSSSQNKPAWSYPVIVNEIFVTTKNKLKKDYFDLKLLSFAIKPNNSDFKYSDFNTDNFQLDLDTPWQLNRLKSYSSSRDRIYSNSIKMFYDYLWFGCGIGCWSSVYSLYRDIDEPWEAWAHCDWLEYLLCLGLLGFIPTVILFCLFSYGNNMYGVRSLPLSIKLGLNLAIAGCLINALFDFPLNVLSVMHLFAIICSIKHCSITSSVILLEEN